MWLKSYWVLGCWRWYEAPFVELPPADTSPGLEAQSEGAGSRLSLLMASLCSRCWLWLAGKGEEEIERDIERRGVGRERREEGVEVGEHKSGCEVSLGAVAIQGVEGGVSSSASSSAELSKRGWAAVSLPKSRWQGSCSSP